MDARTAFDKSDELAIKRIAASVAEILGDEDPEHIGIIEDIVRNELADG